MADDPQIAENQRLKAELVRISAQIEALAKENAALKLQIERLQRQLGQNSSNSNKPPSSDGPAQRPRGGGPKQGSKEKKRKRGGQKGHKGSRRELLAPDQVDAFVDHFPSTCENCHGVLPRTRDEQAYRFQITELPPIVPHVTEHRCHAVTCPGCRYTTKASHKTMPTTAFGPRLTALVGLFTGVYHLSRRRAQELMRDVLGVTISLGALSNLESRVSDAVVPAVDDAWHRARDAEVKHTDGTGWLQAGKPLSLWTIATTAVTVYRIVANGAKAALEPLFGELKGILVSDRAAALNFWAMENRQVCWAHLLRKFVSFSERDGPAGGLGRDLLNYTGLLFEYWRDRRDQRISEETFQSWMAPVRRQLEAALERGRTMDIDGVSGSCDNMLAHREALWTFVERPDVEPTNNHGERELRAFVLWRKRSFGTQSERGNLFAERIMTVAHTARKQGTHVLDFLTACCSGAKPSLFNSEDRP